MGDTEAAQKEDTPTSPMRRLLLGLLVLVPQTCALPAEAQTPLTVRAGVVMDSVRRLLNREWREGGPERAWCITEDWTARFNAGREMAGRGGADTIYRVFAIDPAPHDSRATVREVRADCPGAKAVMHEHRPTGDVADCNPSRDDYDRLLARGDPYAVIWCDRRVFRFYYPSDVRRP